MVNIYELIQCEKLFSSQFRYQFPQVWIVVRAVILGGTGAPVHLLDIFSIEKVLNINIGR